MLMVALLLYRMRTDNVVVLMLRLTMRIFSWFSPRAAEFLAPPLAGIVWRLSAKKRYVTRLNLAAVYPHLDAGQRKKIGRSAMTNYVRGLFEAGMLWHWPLEKVYRYFDSTRGLEILKEGEETGKGVIVAAPHCGSWEMLNLFLHQYSSAAILYKPGKNAEIDEMMKQKRSKAGAEMVPATATGLRTMFKLLKTGRFVALLPDQEPTRGEGQFAPFLGVEALTGVLLPRMAQRTGALVIFAVCERLKGGKYRVHVFKADDEIYSKDMREALTAVNKGVERCIEVDPNQYLWAYKRFRNQPAGKGTFYRG